MAEKAYSGKIPNTGVMSVTAPKKKQNGHGTRLTHSVTTSIVASGIKGRR